MATLLLIASLIVFGYALFVKGRFNVISISQSYYKLQEVNPKLGGLFTLWSIVPAFLLFPIWVEVLPVNWQFLSFLSVVFLGAVGCAPRYLTDNAVSHVVFAILASAFSLLACVALGTWLIAVVIIGVTVALMWWLNRYDYIFWLEVAAFLAVFLSIASKL